MFLFLDILVNLKMACLMRQIFLKCYQIPQLRQQNLFKVNLTSGLVSTCHKLYSNTPTPYEIVDPEAQGKLTKSTINKVNALVADRKQGRLFAVVHLAGKQFKVTDGDVIVIEGYWPPNVGDKISLDKVLLAAGSDFTLVGRPIVQKGLVKVEATVIEKTLSHTKTHFRKKRRKQYMRINFYRIPQTYLRINKVQIEGELNNPPEVRGLETAIF
ncbi:39S ribosomal protein L21, mitochondrial [Anoplophora glabripennis]|nr:39S ribosomal protein L21, mitochondrial [Anoplophora glabripennis]